MLLSICSDSVMTIYVQWIVAQGGNTLVSLIYDRCLGCYGLNLRLILLLYVLICAMYLSVLIIRELHWLVYSILMILAHVINSLVIIWHIMSQL